MSLSNNVEDNRRRARQVFISVHQPLLKDVLSSHEISLLIKEDHILLQEFGVKMHYVFLKSKSTKEATQSSSTNSSTSTISLYTKQIDNFLAKKDDVLSLYLETIYKRKTIPSSNMDHNSASSTSSTTLRVHSTSRVHSNSTSKKGYLQTLLADKPIPRKKVNNVTKNKPTFIDKRTSQKHNDKQKLSNRTKVEDGHTHQHINNHGGYRHTTRDQYNRRDNYQNSLFHHRDNRNNTRGRETRYNDHNDERSYNSNPHVRSNNEFNDHTMQVYYPHTQHPYPPQSFHHGSYNPHPYNIPYPHYGYVPITGNHQPRNTEIHGHPLNHSTPSYNNQHPTVCDHNGEVVTNSPVTIDKKKDIVLTKTTNNITNNETTDPSSIIMKKVSKTSTLTKPIIYEKKDSLNKSITVSTSMKLQKFLFDSNILTSLFLQTPVTLFDSSTTVTTAEGKSVTDQINGVVIRCFKKEDKVYWKIELYKSKYFIIVDTELLDHIITCSKTQEYYKVELFNRNGNEKSKVKRKKTNKRKLKTVNDYIDNLDIDSCVFCGIHSRKLRRKEVKSSMIPATNLINNRCSDVLTCSNCKAISCCDCLQSLLLKMDSKNEEKDIWHHHVVNFLRYGDTPNDFVGHCCEISLKVKELSENLKEVQETPATMNTKYDGCLHFPQLHILLDTPYISHVDIHGLGREQPLLGTPGLLHGVVDKDCAMECEQQKLVPSGTSTKLLSEHQEIIEFNNIYQEKESLRCCIQTFEIDNLVNDSELKHYHPTPQLISSSKHMQMDMTDIDVWIILAKPSPKHNHCHLVNMRWKSKLDFNKWSNDLNSKHLFNTIKSSCKNNGYEAKRTGGSNGFTSYNNRDIVNLLATNTAFPRKGKGVKVVKKDKKWTCYYHGVRKKIDRRSSLPNFVSWSYTQPKIGGNFEMKAEIIDEFQDIIFAMTEIKYNSACLIGKLNIILNTTIQQLAVESAIDDMNIVRKKITTNSSNMTSTVSKDLFLRELAMKNKFTLVAYPCGYHHDVFDKRSFSLENKICFGYENSNHTSNSIGRGGQGINMFVFALLDWTNTSK